MPFRIEADRGKVRDNLGTSKAVEPWHVFHDDVSGSYLIHQTGEVRPQPPRIGLSLPFTRERNRLTGEPAADNVNGFQGAARQISHISVSSCVGPMFVEDSDCVLIDLYLPAHIEPCALESEVDPTDP